jgi:hypothetical protein
MKITMWLAALLVLCGAAGAGEGAAMKIWAVDPLVKVFPDDPPLGRSQARTEVARGEFASLQVVVRCDGALEGLTAEVAPLQRSGGDGSLAPRPARFVGYVPVDRPMQTPCKDQLRKPPADFPDPLFEKATVNVAAGTAQAVWITVPVPVNAEPGAYKSEVRVRATVNGAAVEASKKLEVRVYDVVLGRPRLWTTQWFGVNAQHMAIHPEAKSDEYYALLGRFARNMAEHYENVAIISPLSLAAFGVGPDGSLTMDFSEFDRWVDVFIEAGVVGRIEGGHIGGRSGNWVSPFVVRVQSVKDGKVAAQSVAPDSAEADAFYSLFFPALVSHLREKGWIECYTQHLADEPVEGNKDSYRAMAALARKYAPELKIIEACHSKDLVGAMDIWVPQLNYLADDFDHYRARQEAGDEVWFYTCVFPQAEYANRFIEQPLIKTRLLHWINFKYGITGYLHWGYNHWTADSPFTHTTRAHGGPEYLPAGDPWIVYPGEDGPLDSIRYEAMRDGIADHELLSMLAEKDPDRAMKLAGKHVLGFAEYDTDVRKLRANRRQLLKALE